MGEKTKKSTRQAAGWARAAGWALRHPVMSGIPVGLGSLGVSAYQNPIETSVGAAAAVLAVGGWYQGHPESWDGLVAPKIRAFQRRWLSTAYMGPWWRRITEECGLVTVHRATDAIKYPRVVRVRSHSPSTETVIVRLLIGQTPKQWEDAADALAVALDAERVGVERVSPQRIALIVQRTEPFTQVIVPPEIPDDPEAIDLKGIYLGETEFGTDWCEPLMGQHVLVAGASGSGKNSVTWMYLRALAPLISEGLVRIWVGNPKETEMAAAQPISYRYATTATDIAEMIHEFWSTMENRKTYLAQQGIRSFTPTRETPLDLLLIDELAALTAYSDSKIRRRIDGAFPLILSQARSLGGSVLAALQEPTKAVLPDRELFTLRIQMRASSSQHPDMTLGEDMRQRGALADEIPNTADTAGIGFVVRQRTRTPVRVRAAYCNDDDIQEVVTAARGPITQLDNTPVDKRLANIDNEEGWYDDDD